MLFGANGNFHHFADDGRIAFVTWMHRNRAVAQHGFGARGGNRDIIPCLAEGDIAVFILL